MAHSVATDPRIGTELAGYRIEELLGRGGMSVVYLAEDPQLRRKVALKLLAPDLAEDERFREQFLRESQLAASIDHPNIIPIYEAGEIDGLLYIAMRYVKGTDLAKVLAREGALEPRRTLAILAQVANALDTARFSQGLIHRDVKPGNILIGPAGVEEAEHVYLADFGLTKHATDEAALTEAGHFVGTLDYVAPEQIEGDAATAATDVYSLGCVLYQCLTSEVPFHKDTKMALLWAHLEQDPPRPSQRDPELPESLDDVIAQAMAKEPAERYSTCRELIEGARTELQVSEEVAIPAVPPAGKSKWRWIALAAIVVLLAAVAAVAALLALGDGGGGAPEPVAAPPAAQIEPTADEAAGEANPTEVAVISALAGTGEVEFSGDGGQATTAGFLLPAGIAVDAAGNVYVGDGNRLRRVNPAGVITTIAGTGRPGFSGDGGPATAGEFDGGKFGLSVAADAAGNVYVSDPNNNRIRKIDSEGIVTTIAGTGAARSSGDGGPAVDASLARPIAVAVDQLGNVYFAEWNGNRIRRIDPNGIVTTIAGTGRPGYSGDRGPATEAELDTPHGVAVDASGNVFFADRINHVIRRIDTNGTIRTIAGTGEPGFSGDRGRAFNAQLWGPEGVVVDPAGNLYIVDETNNRIRRIDASGFITTVAGTGRPGDAGNGGPATAAELDLGSEGLVGIAFDPGGNLVIVDAGNNRVRKVTIPAAEESEPAAAVEDGSTITTVAGSGEAEFSGDGGPATEAGFAGLGGLAFDLDGNMYVGDGDRVRRIDGSGIITTIAGTATSGYAGDGGPATAAEFAAVSGTPVAGCRFRLQCVGGLPLATGSDGNVYVADLLNHRIRSVDTSGIVRTIAGTGEKGSSGDGGPARAATIDSPIGITVDGVGNIYFVEEDGYRIRKIDANGIVTTVAGTGRVGFSEDGELATEADLNQPIGVAVDKGGVLYFSDAANHVVRRVGIDGTVRTFAGTGEPGYSGDKGRAFNAQLFRPEGLALDTAGNLYIADAVNNRIRRVDRNGFITTVAGTGQPGFSGDGGPASAADLNLASYPDPIGLAVDAHSNLYIADSGNARIRKVTFAGEP